MSEQINPSVFPLGDALPEGSFTGAGYLKQLTDKLGTLFNVTFGPGSHKLAYPS